MGHITGKSAGRPMVVYTVELEEIGSWTLVRNTVDDSDRPVLETLVSRVFAHSSYSIEKDYQAKKHSTPRCSTYRS